MPLTTTTPVAVQTANTWQIVGFSAILPLSSDEVPSIQIAVAAGTSDGQAVTWYAPQAITVAPDALLAVMAAPVAEGATLYAALKAALYGYLRQAGHIPQEATES
jgi:hypothetical protein